MSYERKELPTAVEAEPSLAVRLFHAFLQDRAIESGRLVDLGCGRGRNSFFLAAMNFPVSAVDLAPGNIAFLQQEAERQSLAVEAACLDLGSAHWPYPERFFRLAVDDFCYRHLVEEAAQSHYRAELRRVLKAEGLYMLSLEGVLEDPTRRLMQDPGESLSSLLYTRDEIQQAFAADFDLLSYIETHSPGFDRGREYRRRILTFIFGPKRS